MAILNTPFQLPLGLANQEMSTLLFDLAMVETITPSGLMTDLIEATNFGTVANGKGKIITYKTGLQPIHTRSKTSTLLDLEEPVVKQEALLVDTYEYAKVSTDQAWTGESFTNGSSVGSYISSVQSLAKDSLTSDLFDKVVGQFDPTRWSNRTVVTGYELSQPNLITEKNQQLEYNAKMIAQFIKNRTTQYMLKRNDLTDVSGVVTILKADDLRLYVDSALLSYIEIALSGVYNQENLRNLLGVTSVVVLPNETGSIDLSKPAFYICHKYKVSHVTGYMDSGSFYDSTTMYTSQTIQRGIGLGNFSGLAGEAVYLRTPVLKVATKANFDDRAETTVINEKLSV